MVVSYISFLQQVYPTRSQMQDKNKNNFLDKLAATSWGVRAGPPKKNIMGSPGGPTLKKNKKIFLVVVAHFLRCANTTDLSGGSKRASTYLELPCHTASITLLDIAQKCSDTLKPQKFCMVSGGTSH